MSCINPELLQKYIDQETSEQERLLVKKHLANCEVCADKLQEKQAFSKHIKGLMQSMDAENVPIPSFEMPKVKKVDLSLILKRLAYVASVACLVLIVSVLLWDKQEEDTQLAYFYMIEDEYDANLPLSEQEMMIEIIDANGRQVQAFNDDNQFKNN